MTFDIHAEVNINCRDLMVSDLEIHGKDYFIKATDPDSPTNYKISGSLDDKGGVVTFKETNKICKGIGF